MLCYFMRSIKISSILNKIKILNFTKSKSKWIMDLNIKYKTIKIEGNTGENLDDLSYGDNFWIQH